VTPLFQENLLKRHLSILKTGDFSEGRNEIFKRIASGQVEPPNFFIGGGLSYSRQVAQENISDINSFEYPIIMLAYDVGILGTVLIYTVIFIIPCWVFLKNRRMFLLIAFLALLLYMNGHNDIANYTDGMGQFCFIEMILINLVYRLKEDQERVPAIEEVDNV
jgi:hypothetical protein